MAIIWEKQQGDVCYQLRTAGRSRRLYSNGVCHSQYHPDRPVTRSIWDLLMLPVFLRPLEQTRRVLLLGLGGGAVVHLFRHFTHVKHITAVELDATHIEVSRKFFALSRNDVDIHHCDAADFVAQYRGEKFDMVIDDLFSHHDGIPRRAIEANTYWFTCLNALLRKEGLLVINFADRNELLGSAFYLNDAVTERYKTAVQLSHKTLENRVIAFSRAAYTMKKIRNEVRALKQKEAAGFEFSSRNLKYGSTTASKT